MTWEEKLHALNALAECHLLMREPGNWYVSQRGVSIGGDGVLQGKYGNGVTPQIAVENHWAIYSAVNLNAGAYIVVEHAGERKHYVWANVLWREVPR